MLSVVIPAYNEEEILPKTAEVLSSLLEGEKIRYELIFVDDGSKDRTWDEILKAHEKNENIHGVHFSRNFGKEPAIAAGLAEAAGDCVACVFPQKVKYRDHRADCSDPGLYLYLSDVFGL